MQMTDGEVLLNIKQAKDQKAQISICADLNCCSEEKIKDILKAQGVDLRSLRGATKKRIVETKHHETKPTKAPTASTNGGGEAKPQQNPIAAALATLHSRVAELRKQKEAIEDELVAIDIQLNRISDNYQHTNACKCSH